jgi:hypothetical protein
MRLMKEMIQIESELEQFFLSKIEKLLEQDRMVIEDTDEIIITVLSMNIVGDKIAVKVSLSSASIGEVKRIKTFSESEWNSI